MRTFGNFQYYFHFVECIEQINSFILNKVVAVVYSYLVVNIVLVGLEKVLAEHILLDGLVP